MSDLKEWAETLITLAVATGEITKEQAAGLGSVAAILDGPITPLAVIQVYAIFKGLKTGQPEEPATEPPQKWTARMGRMEATIAVIETRFNARLAELEARLQLFDEAGA